MSARDGMKRILMMSVVAVAAMEVVRVERIAASPTPKKLQLPAGATVVANPAQILSGIMWRTANDSSRLGAEEDGSRGIAREVFPQVASAIVIVRSGGGHGTGFVVDPDGWILTNFHVVQFAQTDLATGARTLKVYFGRMVNGTITLSSEVIPALVYKESPEKDLALLKLVSLPDGKPLPASLALASEAPIPGTDCVALGHPAAAMPWTVRSCEVASIGQWPDDRIEFVVAWLGVSSEQDRSELGEVMKRFPPMKVIVTSCGVNPGDSGGPLLDANGAVMGVTFAIPQSSPFSGISLDKFAYHIHVDEVRSFLAERPDHPFICVPSPWPPAFYRATFDVDDDGKEETLMFALGEGEQPTGFMVDLDQSFLPEVMKAQEEERKIEWDFEFALQRVTETKAFYDTDDDGKYDRILTDTDGDWSADVDIELKNGVWSRRESSGTKLLDPSLVKESSRKRFAKVVEGILKSW